MKNELIIKKCPKCGALIKVIKDCDCQECGVTCCNEPLKELVPDTVDAAIEKHIPVIERVDDILKVRIDHVMEKDHYIEWIAFVSHQTEIFQYLKPGEIASATFSYEKGAKIYAYCNKHELWVQEVK